MSENWKKQRWLVPLLIPILLFIVFNTWYSLPKLHNSMLQERQNQIQDHTRIGRSILSHFYSMEQEGILEREEAQLQAKQLIRSLRFGPHNKDYFWINNDEPTLVVHPFSPHLEGVDLSKEEWDKHQLFVSFVELVENEGGGFLEYKWQYYDHSNRVETKISYVTGFDPWNWIIGTGLYLDDMETKLEAQQNINFIFIITSAQLMLVGLVIYRLTTNRKNKNNP
ncbi:cache domain-containing protein [Tindallia californiensis]|nr:cache domain-containing protein [Tindallia californiensis]